jgi:hypothetical protein
LHQGNAEVTVAVVDEVVGLGHGKIG